MVAEWEKEAHRLIGEGKTIHAIKLIREQTGLDLREAKELADKWQRGERPDTGFDPTAAPVPVGGEASGCSGCGCLVLLVVFTGCMAAVAGIHLSSQPSSPSPPSAETEASTTTSARQCNGCASVFFRGETRPEANWVADLQARVPTER